MRGAALDCDCSQDGCNNCCNDLQNLLNCTPFEFHKIANFKKLINFILAEMISTAVCREIRVLKANCFRFKNN